jgi:predicted phosphodiesterase
MRQRLHDVFHRQLTWSQVGKAALVAAVAVTGAVLGMLLAGSATQQVGPLVVRASVTPSLTGDSVISVPPLGTITLDSHDGPLRLNAVVEGIDSQATSGLVQGHLDIGTRDQLLASIRGLLIVTYVRAFVSSIAGAALLVLVVWRRPRRAALAAVATAGVMVVATAVGALTWDESSLSQPRYTGLLVYAPNVIGQADRVIENFDQYGDQLADLVNNVAQLSATVTSLPTFKPNPSTVRVLHVSDIHLNPSVWPIMRTIIKQYNVDIVVDTGDIADHGTAAEAAFVKPIGTLGVPYIYVRGNHDSMLIQNAVAAEPNAIVLDGNAVTVDGLRFMGSGDPQFTPDQLTQVSSQEVVDQGKALARAAARLGKPVDVFMVHDPTAAPPLADSGPLVLAGHVHHREDEQLDADTELLVQGSSGGAGLRALQTDQPTPLTFSVLYFNRQTGLLEARDEITLGGLGTSTAQVARILSPSVAGRTS